MDLTVSDTQEELRASVRDVLERECTPDVLRARVEDATRPDPLWVTMVALGWPALTVAGADGGLGLGFAELIVVLEELGYAAAPGPLLPTLTHLVPAVVGADDDAADLAAAIASGERTGSLARGDLAVTGSSVTGTARHVIEGDWVDTFVVVTDAGVGAVAAADATVTAEDAVDATRQLATVVFDRAPMRHLGGPDLAAAVTDHAVIGLAVETVGTAQRLLDLTVDYVRVREQFGRPIGSFQAVKHLLADSYVAVQTAQATCWFAALTVAENDDRRSLAAGMAKAAASDTAREVAQRAIQLHGGIGYTWEHDLHLFVKRARTNAALLGDGSQHRQAIADVLGV